MLEEIKFENKAMLHSKLADSIKTNYESVKTRLLQTVEELKMRRINDKENEDKINKLITEKFELKKTKEEEINSLNTIIENLKQEHLQLQKGFDEKTKVHEEEKAAQNITINSSSKGISSLKDEILALQLSKHSLEKKVKDMDHQLQVESHGKNEIANRLKEFEKSSDCIHQQFIELNTRLEYLSNLVVKTEDMHQKLIQVNTHQKCIISNHQTDILKYQKEIMSKTALLKESEMRMEPKDNQDNDNKHNDTQMKEMLNLQLQLEKELETTRNQKKFLMSSLSECNTLLSTVQSKYDESNDINATLHFNVDEMKTQYQKCIGRLENSTEEIENLQNKLKEGAGANLSLKKKLDEITHEYEIKLASVELILENRQKILQEDKSIQTAEILNSRDSAKENLSTLEVETEQFPVKEAVLDKNTCVESPEIIPIDSDDAMHGEDIENETLKKTNLVENEVSQKPQTRLMKSAIKSFDQFNSQPEFHRPDDINNLIFSSQPKDATFPNECETQNWKKYLEE